MGNLTHVRWVRAVVLSLLIVAGTFAAHAAGGGVLPDPSMLLPVCALLTVVSAALLRRPLSWWWTAALLLAGQTALHGALQVLPAPASAPGMAGHAPRATPHLGVDPGVTALRAVTEWSPDARMVAAHVGAAVLVGGWLAAGERAVWSLLALAAGTTRSAWLRLWEALPVAADPTAARARCGPAPWRRVTVPARIDWSASCATRRGPPAGCCAWSP
ncbi:MAG: hypothetical protein ACKOVB_15495 [Terrabacter sp.]